MALPSTMSASPSPLTSPAPAPELKPPWWRMRCSPPSPSRSRRTTRPRAPRRPKTTYRFQRGAGRPAPMRWTSAVPTSTSASPSPLTSPAPATKVPACWCHRAPSMRMPSEADRAEDGVAAWAGAAASAMTAAATRARPAHRITRAKVMPEASHRVSPLPSVVRPNPAAGNHGCPPRVRGGSAPPRAGHEAQQLAGRAQPRRVVVGQRGPGARPAVVGPRQAQALDAQAGLATAIAHARDEPARGGLDGVRGAAVAARPDGGVARHRAGPVGLLAGVGDDGVGGAVDVQERGSRGPRARVEGAVPGGHRHDGGEAPGQRAGHARGEAGAVRDACDGDAARVEAAAGQGAVEQAGHGVDVGVALLVVERPEGVLRRGVEHGEALLRGRRARRARAPR